MDPNRSSGAVARLLDRDLRRTGHVTRSGSSSAGARLRGGERRGDADHARARREGERRERSAAGGRRGRAHGSTCRGGGIRTRDLVLPKHVRYQAALRPVSPMLPPRSWTSGRCGAPRACASVRAVSGDKATSQHDDVLTALLIVALAVGASLFFLLWRGPSSVGRFETAAPVAVDCPSGTGAPVCYDFDITNVGETAQQVRVPGHARPRHGGPLRQRGRRLLEPGAPGAGELDHPAGRR